MASRKCRHKAPCLAWPHDSRTPGTFERGGHSAACSAPGSCSTLSSAPALHAQHHQYHCYLLRRSSPWATSALLLLARHTFCGQHWLASMVLLPPLCTLLAHRRTQQQHIIIQLQSGNNILSVFPYACGPTPRRMRFSMRSNRAATFSRGPAVGLAMVASSCSSVVR